MGLALRWQAMLGLSLAQEQAGCPASQGHTASPPCWGMKDTMETKNSVSDRVVLVPLV